MIIVLRGETTAATGWYTAVVVVIAYCAYCDALVGASNF